MTKPSDRPHEKGDSSDAKRFKLREGAVTKPTFREVPAHPVTHPKRIKNPQDRKNFILGLVAVIFVLVILVLLEFKQLRDAAAEKESPAQVPEQSK